MKKINGKFYKEVEIVMLPRNKDEEVGDIVVNTFFPQEVGMVTKTNILDINSGIFRFGDTGVTFRSYKDMGFQPQHLFFLSDDYVEEDDWFYNATSKRVYQNHMGLNISQNHPNERKIVASTDRQLDLPFPSQEIIDDYCYSCFWHNKERNIILVECETPLPEWMLTHAEKLAKEIRGEDISFARYHIKTEDGEIKSWIPWQKTK